MISVRKFTHAGKIRRYSGDRQSRFANCMAAPSADRSHDAAPQHKNRCLMLWQVAMVEFRFPANIFAPTRQNIIWPNGIRKLLCDAAYNQQKNNYL